MIKVSAVTVPAVCTTLKLILSSVHLCLVWCSRWVLSCSTGLCAAQASCTQPPSPTSGCCRFTWMALSLKQPVNSPKTRWPKSSDGSSFLHPGQLAEAIFELQVESFQILSLAKRFLLRAISQKPATSLSSRQLTQVTYKHTVFIRPVEQCQSHLSFLPSLPVGLAPDWM